MLVPIQPGYFRPVDVEPLLGDPTRAKENMGWAAITTLEDLAAEMLDADCAHSKKKAYLKRKGFSVVGSMGNPPCNPEVNEVTRGAGGRP